VGNDIPPPRTRRERLWAAAAARGIPLPTILTVAAVLVALYLLAKIVYRLRDVLLLILVAAFVSVLLNPLVVALQRWKIRRRGWAVAVVTLWAVLVFLGLALAFGYPLANGIGHLAQKMPSYVAAAQHGRGSFEQQHPGHPLPGGDRRHQPGVAAADDHDIPRDLVTHAAGIPCRGCG